MGAEGAALPEPGARERAASPEEGSLRVELESPPALGHREAEGPDVGHCVWDCEIQEHTDSWVAGAEITGEGEKMEGLPEPHVSED